MNCYFIRIVYDINREEPIAHEMTEWKRIPNGIEVTTYANTGTYPILHAKRIE